jgi:hypothetical protein
MQRHVWFCSCCRHTMHGVGGTVIVARGCCGCWHCGVWVLHVVCRGHCHRGAWVLRRVGVVAAIVVAHGCCGFWHRGAWVLRLLSSHRAGCCACHRHTMQGVVGAVITPCGSCPHHASLLSSPSIEGPGGPSRERQPYTSARRQYLDAKVDVSQEKKRKRREKSYW